MMIIQRTYASKGVVNRAEPLMYNVPVWDACREVVLASYNKRELGRAGGN